ncbi:MAG: cysteinyl-tRNA synthetase [Chloroflexota bacterium]
MNTGPIILLGSGETSPSIRKVYDWLFRQLEIPTRVSILETPAGFEPNSDYVAGQIGTYLEKRLQNYHPQVSILPARKRGTELSPDNPAILQPLYDANAIFMGPGSPTYAARQLNDSLAYHMLRTCNRMGTAIVFASATSLACSQKVMPIYEIYKVGEELHWKEGLDFFGDYGLSLIFVPHWNNNDGGKELDTSRCYIGQDRFHRLLDILPDKETAEYTVVGIDENTALIIDPDEELCRVMGPGGVTIVRELAGNVNEQVFAAGSTFSCQELGPFQIPNAQTGIPADVWSDTVARMADAAEERARKPKPSDEIMALVRERTEMRERKEWQQADVLRAQIEAAGWQVMDTPQGPVVVARE